MGYILLRNCAKMPIVGIGTYMLKGDVLKQALDFAIFKGYRHIDTALSYGNESEIGEVVADRLKNGTLRRKDLFVTTKVPPVYLAPPFVAQSVEMSLENLKMQYVDMVLIHSPWGCINRGDGQLRPINQKGERVMEHYDLLETWKAFESVYNNKLAKNIGVSNFTANQIERICQKAIIIPSNLQTECHVYLQQRRLRLYCASRGIVVSAYAPLGAPASPYRDKQHPLLLEDHVVEQLARKYKKSAAQILLNFLINNNIPVLPKSQNQNRLRENLDVIDWTMSPEDTKLLLDLDCGVKYFMFDWAKRHPEYFENEPF
ncbi:aldo-keto reductase family 1 member B10-like [Gigantopelta aegis]|uniref:aldo-keto reductase family 1 member B10-like n=1 Tax=Gigantopelta aegis TaxID=1735272 RepID=UPI001B889B01|nr:aldo-keto reductase family 1 member B10-like [Gigantopelta aegis]